LIIRKFFAPALMAALAITAFSSGQGHADGKKNLNQDQVHELVKSGEIRPLDDVLAAAAKVVPGQVIKVEVERKRGRLIYELKIISDRGRVHEVYVDAATLDIVKVE
jgi:uncharacterized membrane protein YkoI